MNLLTTSFTTVIADVVIAIILVVSCIIGFNKGFIKSLITTFGGLLATIFALLLCSAVTTFLEARFGLITIISDWVSGVLSGVFGEEIMTTTLRDATEASLTESNLSAWIVKIVIDVKGTGDFPLDTTVSQIVSPVFGYYITCIIAVIGLTIILRIIFFIIGELMKSLHQIALIGFVDKTLGLVFGLIRGVLIAQLLIVIVKVLPFAFCQELMTYIDQSFLAGFINKINLFAYILNVVSQVNLLETIKAMIIK